MRAIGVLLAVLTIGGQVWAQTDDLMIVEYVDWSSGDGFAIEIYNPTASAISLSNYWVRVFNNGSTSSSSSTQLSGTLASKASMIFGNNAYCANNCSGNCDQNAGAITGVNGNDVIAIVKGGSNSTNFVDMVNLYGVDVYPKVDGVAKALEKAKITRRCSNTTRYTATDGTSPNSWPNNSTTNVTGWIAGKDNCIVKGFKEPDFHLGVGYDTTICSGSSLVLDAGAGYGSYRWSTGATTRTITVSSQGDYRVVVDSGGCRAGRDTFHIKITPKPNFTPGFDSTICKGNSLTLDAGAGFVSYEWSDGRTSRQISTDTSGTFIITVNKGLCTQATDTFRIKVEAPAPLDVGFDSTTCEGLTVRLDGGPGQTSYEWNNGSKTRFIDVTASGQYILTVNKGTCRQNSDTFHLTFRPIPTISLGADTTLCEGQPLTLTAPSGFRSYLWSNGQTTPSISVNSTGTYSVTVNFGACDQASASRKVTFKALPLAPNLSDTAFCENSSVLLDAGAGYASYLWSNGLRSQAIRVSVAGVYSVVVKNADSCSASASVVVRQKICTQPKLVIYNVITPNGDGVNDVFFIEGIADFGPVAVEIFNRWGNRVYWSSAYQNDWNGGELPEGTYFYVVKESKNSTVYKGGLVLLK